MKFFNFKLLVVFLLFVGFAKGEFIRIDFEGLSCRPEVLVSGLRITNSRGTICFSSFSGSNSISNGTSFSNDVEGLRIEHVLGDVFTPVSADLGEFSLSIGAPDPVRFVGVKENGDTVMFEVELDGVADGRDGVEDFETIIFPSSFSDLVSLESPTRFWSVDNLVIDTIAPPDLPENQRLGPSFSSFEFLRSQESPSLSNLVIGEDFSYETGAFSPNNVIFLGPNGFSFSALTPFYDPISGFVTYRDGTDIFLRDRVSLSQAVSLSQVQDAGFTLDSIGNPIYRNGRLVFQGFDFTGNDSFYIFELSGQNFVALVEPNTALPDEEEGVENLPSRFPRVQAVSDDAYAFDTSLEGSTSVRRVYLKRNSEDFQLIVSEGEQTSFGVVDSFEALFFDEQNRLVVEVSSSGGDLSLIYDVNGLVDEVLRSTVVSPVNAGLRVSGVTSIADSGLKLLNVGGVQYREDNENYFKVIGVGDSFDGGIIADLRFLGVSDSSPERVILDIRFESGSFQRNHYIFTISEPVELPPVIGQPVFQRETGRLFLPVSNLTFDRSYELMSSSDLQNWEVEGEIDEVLPLQFIILQPPLPPLRAFYQVEEQ